MDDGNPTGEKRQSFHISNKRPSIPPPTPATNRLLCFLQERKPKKTDCPSAIMIEGPLSEKESGRGSVEETLALGCTT